LVGQFEQFIEVIADQEHGCTAIAHGHDLGAGIRATAANYGGYPTWRGG
jgi:alpha-beta hydrolase superfamily lysophospholipase